MSVEILHNLVRAALLAFVISSTMAMGIGHRVGQIIEALHDRRFVVLAVLSNFIAMPLGALALANMFQLDEPMKAGLLLLGTAAGAPFLPMLTAIARGDLPLAIGTMLLLSAGTIVCLPLVLPMLVPDIAVDAAKIARTLLLLMLLPLAAGVVLKACCEALAARLKPLLDWTCNVSLIPLGLLLAVVNLEAILRILHTRGIVAGVLFIGLGFCSGWLLGGPRPATRRVFALATAQRNVAAALVVGNESFADPQVVTMVIVVTILGFLMLVPACFLMANFSKDPS
jgi:BASS family bile acid:Na+ symporter